MSLRRSASSLARIARSSRAPDTSVGRAFSAIPGFYRSDSASAPLSRMGSFRFMSDSKSSSDGEKSDGSAEGSAAAGATEDETDTAAEGEESGDSVLADKILALEEELKEMKEKVIRSYAEEENVRRIAKRDVDNAKAYATVSFAKALLDVADNLDLTLEAASGEDAGVAANAEASFKTLVEGVQMTNSGLSKTFTQQGIEKFGEVGDAFDPNIHDAIFNMPDTSKEEGTIGQVIKRGYKMKDRVIRAAQVGTVSHP